MLFRHEMAKLFFEFLQEKIRHARKASFCGFTGVFCWGIEKLGTKTWCFGGEIVVIRVVDVVTKSRCFVRTKMRHICWIFFLGNPKVELLRRYRPARLRMQPHSTLRKFASFRPSQS
jgi:hypothetical protein